MTTQRRAWLVGGALLCAAAAAAAQPPVGALAIDERQCDRYGWAVDYERAAATQERALQECGVGCSVVLTLGRCAAYAADHDADSTARGWAESYDSAAGARQAALRECSSRGGGSGCVVRVWGCNSPVVEEELNLDRAARQRIQEGLQAAGFDPGDADGLFGPRTRAAIPRWQSSRGGRASGYLDGPAAEALQTAGGSGPAVATLAPGGTGTGGRAGAARRHGGARDGVLAIDRRQLEPSEVRSVSVTVPERCVQRAGAGPSGGASVAGRDDGRGQRDACRRHGSGDRGAAAAGDARRRPGEVFRDCAECPEPEMVVLLGGRLAMGRYEVTVGECRAFASAAGGGGHDCLTGEAWRNPGRPQNDRHPVTCVNWDDAQAYASWLRRTTGATYRLPTMAEWDRAATGSQPRCDRLGRGTRPDGTCPVGACVASATGLSTW